MVTAEEKLKKMDKKEKALRRVHKLAKEIYIFQRCGIPRKQWKIKTFKTKQTIKVKTDDSNRMLFLEETKEPKEVVKSRRDLDSQDYRSEVEFEILPEFHPYLREEKFLSCPDLLKKLVYRIKCGDQQFSTINLLRLYESFPLEDEAFQKCFISLKGVQILVNILRFDYDDPKHMALVILYNMASHRKTQNELYKLGSVEPLLNIVLMEKNVYYVCYALGTLKKLAKLKEVIECIRKNGGVKILVDFMDNYMDSSTELPKMAVSALYFAADVLQLFWSSAKSKEELWYSGITIDFIHTMFSPKRDYIKGAVIKLLAGCCYPKPKGHRIDWEFRKAVTELKIMPQIIGCLDTIDYGLAADAATTLIGFFDDNPDGFCGLLLKHDGLSKLILSLRKSYETRSEFLWLLVLLLKCSSNAKCRKIIVEGDSPNLLLQMITYPYDSRVVAFAIGTLSELWLCDELRPWLTKTAVPTYLKLIENSRNNLVLAHVAKALGRAADHADSLKLMERANGLTHMARILTPLKREDRSDGGEGFDYHFQPKTIVAVVKSLSEMMTKNALKQNPLKPFIRLFDDLVGLLKHKNVDVITETCRFIEISMVFEYNIRSFVESGVIENIVDVLSTNNTTLKLSLLRILAKCSATGALIRKDCCKNVLNHLARCAISRHKTVKYSVLLVLNGLSEYPISCAVILERPQLLTFLKKSTVSDDLETSSIAIRTVQNIRKGEKALVGHRWNHPVDIKPYKEYVKVPPFRVIKLKKHDE